MPEDTTEEWSAATVYGAKTRKGLVQVRIGDRRPLLLDPEKAREIGLMLVDMAHAAEQDEFLMTFLQRDIGMPLEQAAMVLEAFRVARGADA